MFNAEIFDGRRSPQPAAVEVGRIEREEVVVTD